MLVALWQHTHTHAPAINEHRSNAFFLLIISYRKFYTRWGDTKFSSRVSRPENSSRFILMCSGNLTPSSAVVGYQHFGRPYCLHLHGHCCLKVLRKVGVLPHHYTASQPEDRFLIFTTVKTHLEIIFHICWPVSLGCAEMNLYICCTFKESVSVLYWDKVVFFF
jgi:hypothetical protein